MTLYVAVAEFKNEFKSIVGAGDDAFLGRALQAGQNALDAYLDRTVLADATSIEYFDFGGDEFGGRTLWLEDRGDICSITTVTNGDTTTISSGNYELYPKTLTNRRPVYERLVIKASTGISWDLTSGGDPENAISITGNWGMWSAVIDVPQDFKLSVMELAAFALEKRKSQVFDTVAIPDAGVITIPNGWPTTVTARMSGYRRL